MTSTGNGAATTDSSGWMRRESGLKHFRARGGGGERVKKVIIYFQPAITAPATPRK